MLEEEMVSPDLFLINECPILALLTVLTLYVIFGILFMQSPLNAL